MKQLGINAKLLGGDTICAAEMGRLGGDAVADNVLCAQGGAILDKAASGPAFKDKYKKHFNQEPEVYAASFYDGVLMFAEAMKKANSIEPAKVGAEIAKSAYKGVAGTYAFDEKGNMKQSPVTVFTFKNGQPAALSSY
jgi:branched-chain amino acid transport system substrate-binding protein